MKKLAGKTILSSVAIFITAFGIFKASEADTGDLSKQDIQNDISTLIYTLEHGYSGKRILGDKYEQMITELNEVGRSYPITRFALKSQIDGILSKIPDGHIQVTADIMNPTVSRTIASIPEKDSSCSDPQVEMFTKYNKNILKLTIPTFMIEGHDTSSIIISELNEKLPNADALIVDLRGNTGGYTDFLLRIAAGLWGTEFREGGYQIQYFPNPLKSWTGLQNKVAHGLLINLVKTWNLYPPDSPERALLQSADFSIIPTQEPDFEAVVNEDLNVYDDEDIQIERKGFPRPIYLLVDDRCASACERFMEALEAHPYVTTIGQQTSGTAQFGSIGILTLPKSQINIMIATSHVQYKDNRQVERVGYAPKIPVAKADDSLDIALSDLKTKLK